MKKNLLTAMLFFAFLLIGIQNVSAQYVPTSDAIALLETEIQTIEDNPIYSGQQEQNPTYSYLVLKISFYTMVYEGLVVGETIPNAIALGENEVGVNDDSQLTSSPADGGSGATLSPIRQEIEDLLTQ